MADEPQVPPEPADDDVTAPETVEDLAGPVPGQVLIRMESADPAVADTGFLADLPVYGGEDAVVAGTAPARTGQTTLDEALDAIGARALYRVSAAEDSVIAGVDGAPSALAALVLVEFDPEGSVDDAVATLAAAPGVAEAGPSGWFSIAVTPDDPAFDQQWGLRHVRAPEAWDTTTGAPNVTIAVVDTGCDLTHPDLAGQLGPGVNVLSAATSAQDDQGHGTHVAGIIAAAGDNTQDTAGMTWRCTILPVKALNSAGRAVGTSIAQGIAWAARNAAIVNCSLQGSVDDLAMRAAIDDAQQRGVLVVAAMGNFGWDESKPSFPAAYARDHDTVLAVGAVDKAHRRSVWSATQSSNTGSWIGIAAPGTDIVSLRNGGGTQTMSGTSQACPHVAGAAGLLRSADPSMDAWQLSAALRDTAGALRDAESDPVPNPSYGSGLLDARAALDVVAPVGDFPGPGDPPFVDDGTRVADADDTGPTDNTEPTGDTEIVGSTDGSTGDPVLADSGPTPDDPTA
jgi:subtilisin family serine protease